MARVNKNKNRRRNDGARRFRNTSKALKNQEFQIRKRMQSSRNVDSTQQNNPSISTEMKLRLWALKYNITRVTEDSYFDWAHLFAIRPSNPIRDLSKYPNC